MNDSTSITTSSQPVGLTAWSAPNPFGEPTAYLLVHPLEGAPEDVLEQTIADLGLKRIDEGGDILPIGTGLLYASLRAMQVELCTSDGVWVSSPVTDDWTGHAIGRRYIVLALGTKPLDSEADAAAISAYLTDRESVYAALVKIRVRMEQN